MSSAEQSYQYWFIYTNKKKTFSVTPVSIMNEGSTDHFDKEKNTNLHVENKRDFMQIMNGLQPILRQTIPLKSPAMSNTATASCQNLKK